MLTITRPPAKTADLPACALVLYGDPKVGKSHFAAQFPAPLFLNLENGLKWIDADRVDISNPQHLAETLAEIDRELRAGKLAHRTIVLDGLTTFLTAAGLRVVDGKGHPVKDARMVAKQMAALFVPILQSFYGLPAIRIVTLHSRSTQYEQKVMDESGRSRTLSVSTEEPDCSPRVQTYLMGVADAIGYCHVAASARAVCWQAVEQPELKIKAGNRMGLPRTAPLDFPALRAALTAPAGKPAAATSAPPNGHGASSAQEILNRNLRADWEKFVAEKRITEAHVRQALGVEKVSVWISAEPGRTLDKAMQLVEEAAKPF